VKVCKGDSISDISVTVQINNGNRTEWRLIQSVIVRSRVINDMRSSDHDLFN